MIFNMIFNMFSFMTFMAVSGLICAKFLSLHRGHGVYSTSPNYDDWAPRCSGCRILAELITWTLSPVWFGDSKASTGYKWVQQVQQVPSDQKSVKSVDKNRSLFVSFSSLRLCKFCCAPWGTHLCEGTAMKIGNLWNLWCFIAVHSYLMLLDVTWCYLVSVPKDVQSNMLRYYTSKYI